MHAVFAAGVTSIEGVFMCLAVKASVTRVCISEGLAAFLTGPIMQFAFNIAHFDPARIKHQSMLGTFKVLFGKHKTDNKHSN